MNHTAIDQLFQSTTSTPLGREPSRSGQPKDDLFRSHLERATETTETKPPASKNVSESKRTDEDEPLEPQTGQQETSTDEQQQAATPSESTAETTEDSQSTEQATDEVTLSAAVVAQSAEVAATTEQETFVETPFNSNQQEFVQQAATQLTETTNPTTENQAIALEAALLGEGEEDGEGETASDTTESIAELAGETNSTKTPSFQNAGQIVGATEAKKPQASSNSQPSVPQPSVGQQRNVDEVLEALPENNAQEHSSQSSKGRVEVPSTTATNDLAVVANAELAKASLNSTTETAANTSSSSNTTTTNDTAAVAGRTFGSVLTGKSAEAASSGVESQSSETPTINRARFVQRVGGAIRSAQQRDGQIQLRLSPPELGTLRINIVLNEGVLTARLETETAAARTVLLDNLPALRERLAEQEIRIEKFDVDVGREGQQQADTSDTEDRQANNKRSQTNRASTRKAPTLATEDSATSTTQSITASGLDVRI